MDKINLLIVDDEEAFLESTKNRLELRDFNVIAVNRGDKAIEAARRQPIDIALVDLKMPGISGEETLAALKQEHPGMEVVVLTGHGSVDSAVECTKAGAYSYLQKPCELDKLLTVLIEAFKKRVMSRTRMKQERIEEILKLAGASSPLAILRKLKEMESGQTA
ncbi:MAG TPA: response regulator [bacterium]|nr:response regulator [bacterium]